MAEVVFLPEQDKPEEAPLLSLPQQMLVLSDILLTNPAEGKQVTTKASSAFNSSSTATTGAPLIEP